APPPGFGPRADVPAKAADAPPAKAADDPKAAKQKSKTSTQTTKSAPPANKTVKRTEARAQPAAEPGRAEAPKRGAYGPGADAGSGYRSCVPGDTTPAGTVKDGYRKFEAATPFGRTCRWEKTQSVVD